MSLYQRLPIACTITEVTIAECINLGLPVSRVYTIHVPVRLVWDTIGMISRWAGKAPNPLAPIINILPDARLRPDEWFIEAEGLAFGSEGR